MNYLSKVMEELNQYLLFHLNLLEKLVENYGVQIDQQIHKEVLKRSEKFNSAPYGGFINPKYTLEENNGEITDVLIDYPNDFTTQMMEYAKDYSFLPSVN